MNDDDSQEMLTRQQRELDLLEIRADNGAKVISTDPAEIQDTLLIDDNLKVVISTEAVTRAEAIVQVDDDGVVGEEVVVLDDDFIDGREGFVEVHEEILGREGQFQCHTWISIQIKWQQGIQRGQ